jgi:hypothetical protein
LLNKHLSTNDPHLPELLEHLQAPSGVLAVHRDGSGDKSLLALHVLYEPGLEYFIILQLNLALQVFQTLTGAREYAFDVYLPQHLAGGLKVTRVKEFLDAIGRLLGVEFVHDQVGVRVSWLDVIPGATGKVGEGHVALGAVRLRQVLVELFVSVLLDSLKEGHADKLKEYFLDEGFWHFPTLFQLLIDGIPTEIREL